MWLFESGFFHLGHYFQGSSMLQYLSIIHFFLWLNNNPLYGYATFYLSIHPLTDIWVISTFNLLWIMLLWLFVHKFLHWCVFLFLLGIFLGLEFLGQLCLLLIFNFTIRLDDTFPYYCARYRRRIPILSSKTSNIYQCKCILGDVSSIYKQLCICVLPFLYTNKDMFSTFLYLTLILETVSYHYKKKSSFFIYMCIIPSDGGK